VKTCFISMPFGIKTDLSGALINFDAIYTEVLKPAVVEMGLNCLRADELSPGTLIHKDIFSAVLSSDVMIADISTANPNVMYELGVRHAAQPGATILLTATGSHVPFDVSYTKLISYEIDENGAVTGQRAASLRSMIQSAIKVGLERISVDSPLYQFYPDLHIDLPDELASTESKRRLVSKRISSKRSKKIRSTSETQSAREEPRDAVESMEKEAFETPDVDPIVFINTLKAYRDISAWNDIIRLADELPPTIREAPEVLQLLALALNRRSEPGDQDRAISTMKKLVDETGGDAESYGILGRIYKDRYLTTERREDLDTAIMYYQQGFEKQPTDYYPGVNVVTLLLQRKDEAAKKELERILPRVREAVDNKMRDGLVGYWELATALHLACVAREWDEADALSHRAIEQSPSRWMLETTIRDLETLQQNMDEQDGRRLSEIVGFLRREGLDEEGGNA
jgi:tetratricopeptide (TPR) repeat protein